jgi:hypothetical protein
LRQRTSLLLLRLLLSWWTLVSLLWLTLLCDRLLLLPALLRNTWLLTLLLLLDTLRSELLLLSLLVRLLLLSLAVWLLWTVLLLLLLLLLLLSWYRVVHCNRCAHVRRTARSHRRRAWPRHTARLGIAHQTMHLDVVHWILCARVRHRQSIVHTRYKLNESQRLLAGGHARQHARLRTQHARARTL